MNENLLLNSSPTAQVRLLCEEFLSDGNPHTRKEMENYIKDKLRLLGAPAPRTGCLSGGIRQAILNKNCTKLGTALYQADSTLVNVSERQRNDKVLDCLHSAINTLTALAREIDYVTADDTEISELNKLKLCIKEIKKQCENFQN